MKKFVNCLSVIVCLALWALPAFGAEAARPVISQPVWHGATPMPLKDMPPVVTDEGGKVIPLLPIPHKMKSQPEKVPEVGDPALQDWLGVVTMPAAIMNFDGMGNRNGVLPPDTNGDVGGDYYVQTVNTSLAVYNKTSGAILYGPTDINTLWQGTGTMCESHNDGDPVVLYDHLADRWLISQFALDFDAPDFHQCIAISQTNDPTGAYYLYDFQYSTTKMNDYPKFGVWPDGYYMSVNQFDPTDEWSWAGQGVAVFERDQMIQGNPAQMISFDMFATHPELGGMLPANLDGPAPPAGAPNYFVMFDDDAWEGVTQDQLEVWAFHVDWNTTTNSSFTHVVDLPTDPFVSEICPGYARSCIPQPDTSVGLDTITDRLMYRLQYRNFGDHQSMVVNHSVLVESEPADPHSVDAPSGRAGVRWYHLQKDGAEWHINQQGTYAPADDINRWMGSIAMDQDENIALGYSVSSSSVYPGIRYTGRLAGDPLGTMPQAEGTIIAGSGSQTHSASRWGDYSSMSVDPTDGCTYWYTTEYMPTTGSAPWQTRIASFKFSGCGAAGAPVAHFTGTPITGPAPLTVNFIDQSTGTPTSWAWDFGDGTTSTVQNPSHTYAAVGAYTVSLTATNASGSNTETKTDYISVQAPAIPVADFTGTPVMGAAPLAVNFTDQSTGTPTSWAWDFGDGGTSTAQNPSHTYAAPGTYTVSLTATNAGGSNTMTKTDYITVQTCSNPPHVNFASPNTGTIGSRVTVYGRGFGTSPLVSFNGVQANPVLPGSNAWMLYVKVPAGATTGPLWVENPAGCKSNEVTFTVPGTPPAPPVAEFTGTPTTGTAPLAVNFTDQSTGSPTSWLWDFGDGTTSTAQNPSHTYAAVGSYNVSLTATNAGGSGTTTKTGYITVQAPGVPVTDFTGTPTNGGAPLTVAFTDQSTGSPTSWAWDFGDGGTSTVQNPSHTYTAPGTYTVSLTATNAGGSNTMTKTDYITVQTCSNPPHVNFASPNTGTIGSRVTVYGRGFGTSPLVSFNGVQANPVLPGSNAWMLYVKVPAGATTGPLWVENPAGCKSNEVTFTVNP